MFHDVLVYLYPEGVSSDTRVLLSLQSERLYRLLGQLVVRFSGWLELESDSGEASPRGPWIDGSPYRN
jgi:hypothetical protein